VTPVASHWTVKKIVPYEKRGEALGRPSSLVNCVPFCELEGNPQPQSHGAPAVDSFLAKTADQPSEVRVKKGNILGRINREQFPGRLIHFNVEVTKKGK
jgi:hypothetical protein